MYTAEDIRNVEFSKHMGGYKISEVEAFVESCAETVAALTAEKEELTKKASAFAEKLVQYRNQESSINAALLTAQRMGDSVIADSKEKAEAIIAEANAQAEKIVGDAKNSIGEYEAELARLKQEVSDFKASILAIYKEHLALLKKVPSVAASEAVAAEAEVVVPPAVQNTVTDDTADDAQGAQGGNDVSDDAAVQSAVKSKFANLKFGEGYSLDADDDDED